MNGGRTACVLLKKILGNGFSPKNESRITCANSPPIGSRESTHFCLAKKFCSGKNLSSHCRRRRHDSRFNSGKMFEILNSIFRLRPNVQSGRRLHQRTWVRIQSSAIFTLNNYELLTVEKVKNSVHDSATKIIGIGLPVIVIIGASTCGQSYKHFTLVNYDSRVVYDWKIPHITTLESYFTIVKCL